MKTLGIDIGTTTISAAVLEDGQFLASETRANDAFIPSALACAREQDVEKITQTALAIVQMLFERYPDIHSIGVTGQMHGILYVDADGNAVSPLYTWQDARGSLPHSKTESWVQYLTRKTGCLAAVGFGLATHAYNLAAGLYRPPPSPAAPSVTTLPCAVRIGRARMDDSNAASIGFFDAERCAFDQNAAKAGIDPNFVPQLAADPVIGHFRNAAVCAAIGDNQASFLRSVRDKPPKCL
ncbi:MAG: FGGY family carbohydrate kinase [Butyricicoccus sp.]